MTVDSSRPGKGLAWVMTMALCAASAGCRTSGQTSARPQAQPAPAPAAPASAHTPLVPFERYTLDNGLTVILHEDHRTPVVAVDL